MDTASGSRRKSQSRERGITGISISGYKSLVEGRSIEIRPLTILAGANSSGKSSAMQPLLLLKQTLEVSYDPGYLLLDGPNVRFTSADQFLPKLPGSPSLTPFVIAVQIDGIETLTLTFRKQAKKGIELIEMKHDMGKRVTTLRPEMPHNEIIAAVPDAVNFQQSIEGVGQAAENSIFKDFRWSVDRNRCFLSVGLHPSGKGDSGPSSGALVNLVNPAGPFESNIRKLIHVPGLRGNPERTYRATAVGADFPGTFENYVASVISHWQTTKDDRLGQLGSTLEALGLTWKVETRQVDDTQVELRVGRLKHSARGGARDMVSIADVGFGLSQTLPVLVALLTALPGQMVYLEQPEIHLHPRAQSALARVLVDAAKRGVRIVAETHSSLLVMAIQSLIAEGQIAPDKVKLHWFQRRDDGITEVASADLDQAGAYGDWPEDFADVTLEVESRYLDAAERSLG